MIVYAGAFGVQAVPEEGGTPRMPAAIDPAKELAAQPRLLEGGKYILFVVAPTMAGGGEPHIVVQPLAGGERKVLIAGGTDPRVLPTGHLVYFRSGTLLAVRFDAARLTVSGGPVPVADGVNYPNFTWAGHFAIAPNGTLAFWPGVGDAKRQLVWVDRQGRQQPIAANPRNYAYPRVSPDGTRIAMNSADDEYDVWVFDVEKETLTRLTFGPAHDTAPAWTPDGRHVLFSSGDSVYAGTPQDIFRRTADGTGTPEALTQNLTGGTVQSVSPDGRWLVFSSG